jgi:integrase
MTAKATPATLTPSFEIGVAERAGLENVRFRDLRHTSTSLTSLRGAKSKALGHSSVAFTMDVYSHIIEGMQQDATMLLEGVFRS